MSRFQDFDALLRSNGIPFVGLQDTGGARPGAITIDFSPSATAEQIAWANNAKETFDWRERRSRTRQDVVLSLQSLTTAQQTAYRNHAIVAWSLANPQIANAILNQIGVPLPIDEVDPTQPS